MWIERATLDYGRLDQTIELTPGLNVVHGPNEAGKSTLHDALLRTLFGFSPVERRQHHGSAVRDRARPWAGGPFRSVADLRAVGDRDVRIEWDFGEDKVVVLDRATGTEILREQPQQRREFAIGPTLFGVRLEEYREIACLFQGSIGPIEHSPELTLQLQRAVASTAPDVGVQDADERLRGALSEIGVHAGHYGRTPSGALRVASDRAAELRVALADAEAARAELSTLTVDLRAAREALQAEEHRLVAIDQTILRRRSTERQERRDRVAVLQERIAQRPATPTLLAAETVEAVQTQRTIEEQATSRAEQLRAGVTASVEQVAELEERCATLQRERDDLAPYATVDRSRLDRVSALDAQLREPDDETPPPPVPDTDERLERFREQRPTLVLESHEAPSDQWPLGMVGLALLIAILSVAVTVVASPVGAIGLVLAGVILWAARPASTSTRSRLAEALEPFGVSDLAVLEQQLDAYDRERLVAETRREAWREAQETRSGRQAALREELDAALDGVSTSGLPAEGRLAAYVRSCDLAQRHDQRVAALAEAELELSAARDPQRTYDEQKQTAATARSQLTSLYRRAGIDDAAPADADAAFDALRERAAEEAEAEADARRASDELQRFAPGGDLAALASEATAAAQALREHVAAYGEHDDAPGDLTTLEGLAATSRTTIDGLRETVTERDTTITEREANAPDPAVLREDLAAEEERIERLELQRDAIRLAREELAVAAEETHRAFAPHLNAALEASLPSITDGRYAAAAVDDQLAIRVVAPETGQLVPIDVLSRGTQDQIAMIERLEIARILDPTGGALPLLLDDPFAHFDPARLRAGVRLLAEVAEARQVVLFTDDPVVVDAARAEDREVQVLELDGPVALPVST